MTTYSPRGLHGQTVQELAGRILSGELAEDQTLDLAMIGTELDVSRTALREALKVLAAKGLVGARQRRGTFVRPRGDWNLLDADVIRWQFGRRSDDTFLDNLHELRSLVEPRSAGLAASRRTDQDLATMEAALADMVQAANPADAVRADLAFHRALLAATHNELVDRLELLLETGLASRDRLVHGAKPDDNPAPSHRIVLDAVRARSSAAAERAMDALLNKAREDLAATRRSRASRRGGDTPNVVGP